MEKEEDACSLNGTKQDAQIHKYPSPWEGLGLNSTILLFKQWQGDIG